MSEVPLYREEAVLCPEVAFPLQVQGYLAHKKQPPPRTLQKGYA